MSLILYMILFMIIQGKMSKFIQKYQGSDEDLLCQFSEVELIKRVGVLQVPSWDVSHFPSFNIFQDNTNEETLKGL